MRKKTSPARLPVCEGEYTELISGPVELEEARHAAAHHRAKHVCAGRWAHRRCGSSS